VNYKFIKYIYNSQLIARMKVLNYILNAKKNKQKLLALLIDPDKYKETHYKNVFSKNKFDLVFVGGSLITNGDLEKTIASIKKINAHVPIIIFPGDEFQISNKADAILFLSLISGRNADLLIGKHVLAAPKIKREKIECISTGYILVESGKLTTVSYITQTLPIPNNKPEIAAATALAGEMLGMKLIYLEAGSGADSSIDAKIISAVNSQLSIPLIVGGGVYSKKQIQNHFKAGADLVVVGTFFETSVIMK
jgi:phosphoglycerol geranylgeranyltransferase